MITAYLIIMGIFLGFTIFVAKAEGPVDISDYLILVALCLFWPLWVVLMLRDAYAHRRLGAM